MNWQIWVAAISILPVLAIGFLVAELVMRMHPRRGKRPDLHNSELPRVFPKRVTLVVTGGRYMSGSPWVIALRMGRLTWSQAGALDYLLSIGERGTVLLGEIDTGKP
jgi:hypothetical protein